MRSKSFRWHASCLSSYPGTRVAGSFTWVRTQKLGRISLAGRIMNSKFVAMGVLLAAPISLVSNARAQLKAPATVPPVSLSDAEPATVPPMDLTLSADLGAALYG